MFNFLCRLSLASVLSFVLLIITCMASFAQQAENIPNTENKTLDSGLSSHQTEDGRLSNNVIDLEGRRRSYLLFLPGHDNAEKKNIKSMPLVIVLHGGTGTAHGAAKMTGMNALAQKHNFLVAYPQGVGIIPTWNAYGCCGYANRNKVDDVAFIKELIDNIEELCPVDRHRIYATGISNGGMMCFRLANEMPDTFAAIAPVAASFNFEGEPVGKPVSVMMVNGLEDQFVPYNGGVGTKSLQKRVDKPASYAVDYWRKRNACRVVPELIDMPKLGLQKKRYFGGKEKSEVVLWTLQDSGHVWPGGINRGNIAQEPQNKNFRTSEEIWKFFAGHVKP